ncbi:alcohol dehydrogenase catalytic domain-containing protein [Nonomuraea glycinis]|uniref:alcohol dehydrogenase catalytic domain-containing protein n=1 Tax=Nonomuraea glycinis TaxID=2047744 RepID=UPI002E117C60|nr:alcohol dehydrogenase catalytic domain-containing protein [Nonomuraea glycinis]
MRALTIIPGHANSAAITELDDLDPKPDHLIIQGVSLGICATDRDLASGLFGMAANGHNHLVLGHESVGRVIHAPVGSSCAPGTLVTGYVRFPDPIPCSACAAGESDMCVNGAYTERGIKGRDGFGSEMWTSHPDDVLAIPSSMVSTGVLVEPASVAAKGWAHIDAIGKRAWFAPRVVLISGAGTVGLMCGLLAAGRGLEVHLFDRLKSGPRPLLARGLDAHYHTGDISTVMQKISPDIVIDTTGAGDVVTEEIKGLNRNGILCIIGFSWPPLDLSVDANHLYREMVMRNNVTFGIVNASREHFKAAAEALANAEQSWLEELITRRLPLSRAVEGLLIRDDDIKTIIEIGG